MITVIVLIVVLSGATVGYMAWTPESGQRPRGEHLKQIEQSPNYEKGTGFINPIPTTVGSPSDMLSSMREYFALKNGAPEDSIPVAFDQPKAPPVDSLLYVTWFGHSAFLIELDGLTVLIDPMLTDVPSPVPFGAKRFPYKEAIVIDDIPHVDVMILSHDHYDHLDRKSILSLKDRVDHYVTALGVGSHLQSWGVAQEDITELDWWESTSWKGLELVAAPARHFSGRGLFDRYATQWASWVIRTEHHNVYFSGDGGYGEHFTEIGEKYGPFHFAMLECGQYNEAWSQIHMMPEESVQAGQDVRAAVTMPIHWGAFRLANHAWDEPIVRYAREADKRGIPFVHPQVGERFQPGVDWPQEKWWENI